MSKTIDKRFPCLTGAAAAPILGFILLGTAAPATAAVTESYYQKDFKLTCLGKLCGIELPKVAESSRLKITRISCMVAAQGAAGVGYASYQYAGTETLTNYLAPVQVDPRTAIYNQPTEILIPAEKLLTIALSANGAVTAARCSVTGRLQTF